MIGGSRRRTGPRGVLPVGAALRLLFIHREGDNEHRARYRDGTHNLPGRHVIPRGGVVFRGATGRRKLLYRLICPRDPSVDQAG